MLLVEVRGSFETPNGDHATGSVEFYPRVSSIQSGSEIIATSITSFELDENGAFSVVLQATDAPGFLPTGWTYRVIEKINGRLWRVYDIAIPSASQGIGIDLSTVAPVEPASGDSSTFVTSTIFNAAITAEQTARASADTPLTSSVAAIQALSRPTFAKDFAVTSAQRAQMGNGISKPLSSFYISLAAARADYPLAGALTDELDSTVITAAMDYCRARGGGRVDIEQGVYAVTQVVIPRLVHLKGESWTSFGSSNEGTTLKHVTAQTTDMIRWDDPFQQFIGQAGLTDLVLRGHPSSTAGHGVHTISADGSSKGRFQDMVTVERLLIRGFSGDGLKTYGGSPLRMRDISTIFNGGVGIRIIDDGFAGATGAVQHVVLENISGDGNSGGASVRFEGLQNLASVTLIGMKGEMRANLDRGGADKQPNVLQFDNCAMPVTINGITSICEGSSITRPGDLIVVSGAAHPAISYAGAGVRVPSTQTVGPLPNLISDGTITIPATPHIGQYPRLPGAGRDPIPAGEGSMDRNELNSAAVVTGTGNLRGRFFTARTATRVGQVRVYSGATQAAATPTLVRVGIWTCTDAGVLIALVGSTPNDTTLLAAANTGYTKSLSAPFTLVPGQRYYAGLLVITGTTAPTMIGNASVGGATAVAGATPMMAGLIGGLSDLPVNGTVGGSPIAPYIELLP